MTVVVHLSRTRVPFTLLHPAAPPIPLPALPTPSIVPSLIAHLLTFLTIPLEVVIPALWRPKKRVCKVGVTADPVTK